MKILYFSVNMQKYTSASYQQDLIDSLKKKTEIVFWGPGYENFDINLDLPAIKKKLSISQNKILGASCHNREEILLAKELGCNYVFLSPIIKKYDSDPIGWNNFFKLRDEFSEMAVIPLGGVNEKNSMQESFAGISHWWDLQNF